MHPADVLPEHPPTHEAPAREAPTSTTGAARVLALDVLRGFALCGILLVNAEPVTHFRYAVAHSPATLADPSGWLQLLVQQRFFPVFSLLFGMGSSLFLVSASRRAARPRVLLLRRLLVLLPLGVLHQLLQPGEALAVYAVLGLAVLLPSSWLPRWAVAVGAVVLGVLALVLAGGLFVVPGWFLLGSALARYGVVDRLEGSTRVPLALFAAFAAAAVPAVLTQLDDVAGSGFSTASAVAGALMAGMYVTGVLVLLRTPLRGVLAGLFAPLGRMALTNYVSATPLLVLAGHVLDLPHSTSWTQVLALCAGILLVQWAASTLWLRRHRQGPLEWLWRWATWGRRPTLRTTACTPHRVVPLGS